MVLQQAQQVEANQMILMPIPFRNLKAGQLILWRNKLDSEVLFEDPADDIGIVISVNTVSYTHLTLPTKRIV